MNDCAISIQDEILHQLCLMTRQLKTWTAEIEANTCRIKFNPDQPRVPAGNAHGGEWTDTGASGGTPSRKPPLLPRRKPSRMRNPPLPQLRPAITEEELARFNRNAPPGTPPEDLEIDPDFGPPRWYVEGAVKPSESPLDLIGAGSAVRAAGTIAKTTVTEAASVARVLRDRVTGQRAAEESIAKVKNAADAVEEFLGGRPDPKSVTINPAKDIVIVKGNKKFRMDINNPGYKRGPDGRLTPEEPHFHLQEIKSNGKWGDATNQHRILFNKGKQSK